MWHMQSAASGRLVEETTSLNSVPLKLQVKPGLQCIQVRETSVKKSVTTGSIKRKTFSKKKGITFSPSKLKKLKRLQQTVKKLESELSKLEKKLELESE